MKQFHTKNHIPAGQVIIRDSVTPAAVTMSITISHIVSKRHWA